MVMGKIKENREFTVDWSKFKSNAKGSNLEKAKDGYVEFCKMLDETDFELVSDYVGALEKVELTYKFDNSIILDIRPAGFKIQTYKNIINLFLKLIINGDKFVKFVKLSKKKSLIAKINTFDGGEIDIDTRTYTTFRDSRKEFYIKLKEVNGGIEGYYIDTVAKISIYVDDIKLNPISPIIFKTKTYKAIISFKNKLKENGDKFIKFTDLTNGGNLIAKIKTFDDGIVSLDISKYDSFNKSRQDFYNKLKEVGGSTTGYYADKSTSISVLIEHIKLNSISPNHFKKQTYKAIINFKENLIKNNDKFIKFVRVTDKNNLIAKIKTFDGGEIDIDMGRYSSFNRGRQDTYGYCASKNYKILSPYIGNRDKILIDFNCGHKSHWMRPNDLKRDIGCPICSESKGEKAIREYLEKSNIEFIQEYRFEYCKYKYPLPFDFYIPNYNLCIEFDGRQHFEVSDHFGGEESFELTQIRDNIKNKYCKENSINLLRIPYYEIDSIEKMLNEEFDRLREMKEVC